MVPILRNVFPGASRERFPRGTKIASKILGCHDGGRMA
jgi:hypothetical protein